MCPRALRSRGSLSLSCFHFLPPCHRALLSFLLIYQTSSFPCCHIWYRLLGSMERPVTLHLPASMRQRVWWLVKAPRLSQHTDTDISQRGIAMRSSPPSQRREMKNLELTQSPPRAKRTGTGGGGKEGGRGSGDWEVEAKEKRKRKRKGESKGVNAKGRWSGRGQREVRADRRHTSVIVCGCDPTACVSNPPSALNHCTTSFRERLIQRPTSIHPPHPSSPLYTLSTPGCLHVVCDAGGVKSSQTHTKHTPTSTGWL